MITFNEISNFLRQIQCEGGYSLCMPNVPGYSWIKGIWSIKGACPEIYGNLIFIKLTDTSPTNISFKVKKVQICILFSSNWREKKKVLCYLLNVVTMISTFQNNICKRSNVLNAFFRKLERFLRERKKREFFCCRKIHFWLKKRGFLKSSFVYGYLLSYNVCLKV